MAMAFIMDFAGGGAAEYDAVINDMHLDGRLPPGAVFHAAGATDTGWRVFDVWETAEAFQQFAESQIGPLSAKQGMPAPEIRSFEVAQTRRGAPGSIEFMQIVTLPGLDADGFAAMDAMILGEAREAPDGCVFHVNGQLGDAWCVADCWSSKELRDEFMRTQVGPAMERAGRTEAPQIEEAPVHNTFTEPSRQKASA
jgi:hypothetical protein